MANSVDITIFCITYNHEKYISQALDSFLMQKTEFTYEIVVHDDASTDRTQKVVSHYKKMHPDKIKTVFQTQNQFQQGNYNFFKRCLGDFNGEFVALCEGDDYWTDPEKLQKQVSFMRAHPEYAMTCHATNHLMHTDSGVEVSPTHVFNISGEITTETAINLVGGHLKWLTQVVRKEVYEDVPNFIYNDAALDYPLQIYYTLKGKVHYFNEVMGDYRAFHQEGWTISMMQNPMRRYEHTIKVIDMLQAFDKYTDYKYKNEFAFAQSKMYVLLLAMMSGLKTQIETKFNEAVAKIEDNDLQANTMQFYKNVLQE